LRLVAALAAASAERWIGRSGERCELIAALPPSCNIEQGLLDPPCETFLAAACLQELKSPDADRLSLDKLFVAIAPGANTHCAL